MDSPTIGQGGSEPPAGNVRVWCYLAQPECLVQSSGVGKEEGWQPTVLHLLSPPEHAHEKGLLPPAQNTGGIGEFGRCWTFFLRRSEIRVLADKDGRGVKAVHCLHSKVIWSFSNVTACPLGCVTCWQLFNSLCRIAWVS